MSTGWLTQARRIVVVRPEELGDVILTVPMFPVLREVAPGAQLHFICLPWTAPVARCIPGIHQVHTISHRDAAGELEAHFRRERYDVVFSPHSRSGHAWAAVRARIRHRVGTRGRLYSVLYNHRVPRRREVAGHETRYDLQMIGHLLGREFPLRLAAPRVPPDVARSLDEVLASAGIAAGARLLVVHPGSGNAERWPAARFAAVASRLAADHGLQVVVSGTADESALAASVVEACPGAVSLAGRFSLLELMALLARAALVLGNSTGPTHLATAFDTPVVAILPGRDVERWHPANPRGAVVSPANGSDDVTQVPESAVLEAARRVLALAPSPELVAP